MREEGLDSRNASLMISSAHGRRRRRGFPFNVIYGIVEINQWIPVGAQGKDSLTIKALECLNKLGETTIKFSKLSSDTRLAVCCDWLLNEAARDHD